MTDMNQQNHVSLRNAEWVAAGGRRAALIGRLTPEEFDACDAIDTLLRAGIAPTTSMLTRSLHISDVGVERRMYNLRMRGLTEIAVIDWINAERAAPRPINEHRLSDAGRELFREALQLMDEGKVAA